MAIDNKKAKADPAPKSEAAAKNKSTSEGASKAEGSVSKAGASESKAGANESKTEGSETAAAPSANYSRGEGQKPVTAAYKENWNAIFAKKAKKKKR